MRIQFRIFVITLLKLFCGSPVQFELQFGICHMLLRNGKSGRRIRRALSEKQPGGGRMEHPRPDKEKETEGKMEPGQEAFFIKLMNVCRHVNECV